MPLDELSDFATHHIGDATEIELFGGHWSLEALSVDPIHIGSVAIDLSPTRHVVVMVLVAVLMLATFIPLAEPSERGARRRLRTAGPMPRRR